MKRFARSVRSRLTMAIVLARCRLTGPPRILNYSSAINVAILKLFGAKLGDRGIRIYSPVTIHVGQSGYANLEIADGCILGGNNFLDLSARIILEEGAGLAPCTTVLTHNNYNYNGFQEERLKHTSGKADVRIGRGASIKAGTLITMGVTIGEEAVVAGGAVVTRDVPRRCFAGGIPARVLFSLEDNPDDQGEGLL